MELTIWGTEPVYTLSEENYILSIHRVDTTSQKWPNNASFLSALPNWNNIVSEVKQHGDVFYIAQHQHDRAVPIIRNPSLFELEAFIRKNGC